MEKSLFDTYNKLYEKYVTSYKDANVNLYSKKLAGNIANSIIRNYLLERLEETNYTVSSPNVYIDGCYTEFDLLIVKKNSRNYCNIYDINDVIAIIETKASGAFDSLNTNQKSDFKEDKDKIINRIKNETPILYKKIQESKNIIKDNEDTKENSKLINDIYCEIAMIRNLYKIFDSLVNNKNRKNTSEKIKYYYVTLKEGYSDNLNGRNARSWIKIENKVSEYFKEAFSGNLELKYYYDVIISKKVMTIESINQKNKEFIIYGIDSLIQDLNNKESNKNEIQ